MSIPSSRFANKFANAAFSSSFFLIALFIAPKLELEFALEGEAGEEWEKDDGGLEFAYVPVRLNWGVD